MTHSLRRFNHCHWRSFGEDILILLPDPCGSRGPPRIPALTMMFSAPHVYRRKLNFCSNNIVKRIIFTTMSGSSMQSPNGIRQDEEKAIQPSACESTALDSTLPPEGGLRGWLCCAGASLGLFATLGFLNALVSPLPQQYHDRSFF